MIRIIFILFVLLSPILPTNGLNAGTTRGEIQRYTLLHDRYIVDRGLRKLRYDQFLDIDIVASSGLKSFLGEVKAASKNASTIQRDLAVLSALAKRVNTERFLDIDINLGVPLPYIRYRKFQMLPSLFYNMNMGLSNTLTNQADGINITSQSYVKLEKRAGLLNRIKWNDKEEIRFALYHFTKKDIATNLGVSDVGEKTSVFKFDDANKEHTMFSSDIGYLLKKEKYSLLAEVQELQLLSLAKENQKSLHGTSPFLHTRVTNNMRVGNLILKPFYGAHYRKWYSLFDGLYVGASLQYNQDIPFEFLMKLSPEFITLMPQLKTKYFKFIYSLKAPYRNPNQKIWVSSMHNVNVSIPIP